MKEYKLICDYCGKEFVLSVTEYASRKYTKKKTGYIKNVCQTARCRKLQRQDVIKIMHKKNRESGYYQKLQKMRKGKNFVQLYGEEKAKIIRKKIKDARKEQIEPHLGKKHSKKSKNKMSLIRKRFLEANPKNGENHSKFMVKRYKGLSKEEKSNYSKRAHNNILSIKRHSLSGYLDYWYKGKAFYESSYELVYFTELNEKKIFWKKNTSLLIPYVDRLYDNIKYQKPDILIYKSKDFKVLLKIIEIKPYEFLINPNSKESRYYQITNDKKKGLLAYGKDKKIEIGFITEKELDKKIINLVIKKYGDKKKLKDLIRRKEQL